MTENRNVVNLAEFVKKRQEEQALETREPIEGLTIPMVLSVMTSIHHKLDLIRNAALHQYEEYFMNDGPHEIVKITEVMQFIFRDVVLPFDIIAPTHPRIIRYFDQEAKQERKHPALFVSVGDAHSADVEDERIAREFFSIEVCIYPTFGTTLRADLVREDISFQPPARFVTQLDNVIDNILKLCKINDGKAVFVNNQLLAELPHSPKFGILIGLKINE